MAALNGAQDWSDGFRTNPYRVRQDGRIASRLSNCAVELKLTFSFGTALSVGGHAAWEKGKWEMACVNTRVTKRQSLFA